MVRQKISNVALCSLAYFLMNSLFLGTGLYNMFQYSIRETVICAIAGFILGFIPLVIYLYIFKNSEDLNIFSLNKKIFGNIIGNVFNFILSILALFIAVIILYNLITFLNLNYLVLIDKYYIGVLLVVPLIYALSKGINTISKTSQILMYPAVALFIFVIFGLLDKIKLDNLLPMFTASLERDIYSVIMYTVLNSVVLFILLCVSPKELENREKISKNIIITYILSNLGLITMFFTTLTTLGYDIVSILKYPEYVILKEIKMLGIIERVENIVSIYFIVMMFIGVLICSYYAFKNFYSYKEAKLNKLMLTYLLPIIITLIALNIFPNITTSTEFNITLLPVIIGSVAISIHMIILIRLIYVNKIKNKNKTKNKEFNKLISN